MPKILQAQNIASVGSIQFVIDKTGAITAINVTCEVNYGELGMAETVDILPNLNVAQKMAAKTFYDRLKQILTEILIA